MTDYSVLHCRPVALGAPMDVTSCRMDPSPTSRGYPQGQRDATVA
jgi:hypothetical protein